MSTIPAAIITKVIEKRDGNRAETCEFLSQINMMLVCLLAIICYLDKEIPPIYAKLLLYLIPPMFLVNYFTLKWLVDNDRYTRKN